MPRKPTTRDKSAAKRTSRPGIKVDKVVESSTLSNTRPRQPRLRQTPPRRGAPKPIAERKKPGPKPSNGTRALRNEREQTMVSAIENARATGLLPHEWMLAVMRGEQINHFAYDSETQEIIEVIVLPTFADRMEMARSAARYYSTPIGPSKEGGGGPKDPAKQPGVMEVPLAHSMEKWAEIAQHSQTMLKKEVTK